jgi:signal transduction histidine kinase
VAERGVIAPRRSRTAWAAALLGGALAALLVAWSLAGWADVRAQQREISAAPARAAAERRDAIAAELRGELARLLGREVDRPYFHYQNLMHDPRAGGNLNVSPSPLAAGSSEPLVLGYFQVDGAGRVSVPTINDELPALSEPRRLADHARFRDAVAREASAALRPAVAAAGGRVASAAGPAPNRRAPAQRAPGAQRVPAPPAQVLQVDESTYAQNAMPAEVYRQQNAAPRRAIVGPPGRGLAGPAPAGPAAPAAPASPPPRAAAQASQGPIAISISPLEWRTLPHGERPALVAARRVETPAGPLTQGFVLDAAALARWLAPRAGAAVAAIAPAADGASGTAVAEVAPGWHVDVEPAPGARVEASAAAAAVARAFVVRFVVIGGLAVLAAALVVLVVARAERFARERSQFAAAAAHELRTPLAGLQLYGDMLAEGLGDPAKARDYARRMSEEAARLGRVVSNVLGLAQLERGNLSVDARGGDVAAVVRDLAEAARAALERAGAHLAIAAPLALRARFDRDALARILGNLLDNAEKYTRGAADRTIALTARAAAEGVEIAVTDRGPGVPVAARGDLFRAFRRAGARDGPAGLGLGLALSRSLARAMGGELLYRAAAGGGAELVLRLAGEELTSGTTEA